MVADRAIALADAEGLEAVTIRRLATDLGVTPMALYWHFRTKDELLAGAADRVLEALELPAPVTAWSAELQVLLTELVRVLRAHPQLVGRVAERFLASPAGLALADRALAALLHAGFSHTEAGQLAGHAMRTAMALATDDVVDGSGVSTAERDEHLRQKRSMLAGLPAGDYPSLIACADAMTYCAEPDEFFALGIHHFIAGVEGMAAAG
ncbi:MAG: TetR/AcrR family transcriptional regulator [Jatrophihabitans sp.]